jgi:DNA-binding NarL/FixJ family response regulator
MEAAAKSFRSERRDAYGAGWVVSPEPEPAGSAPRLTPRQREVLELLCQGLPNKLICRRLNISSGTVKVHISSILRELGVNSRLQAVVAVRELNLSVLGSDARIEEAAS